VAIAVGSTNDLKPASWPPPADAEAALRAYVAQHGVATLQAAVSSGQHDHPDGLFFGGRDAAWSNRTLRAIFAEHGARRAALCWIDLHSGLGPCGHGEKIYLGPDEAAALARTRAWFGGDVTSFYAGTSTSAQVTGSAYVAATEACPQAAFAGIGLEFGTVPLAHALQALRASQWLINHPQAPAAAASAIGAALRDAFFVDTDEWKGMLYGQARVAVLLALLGLGAA
jgi:hypothetical protein